MSVQDAIMSSRLNKKKAFLFVLIVFFVDQLTKFLAVKFLYPDKIIEILPFLNFVYVENKGSAFGMFKFLGSEFFIIVSIIVIAVLVFLCFKDYPNWFVYSLIISGALGNAIDRLIYGYVIDFIDLHVGSFHWPAFNIADTAISIGIVLFLYKSLRK
ncbi:signal peptidase II [Thermodesulfovibrio sp. 1176]|jgi:signal peptidase II|uniref:signal peptidase II n=1 Tax=Thermodesulfovibrio sp. 1176 TaxID=3043424 RepID=UPI002482B5BA|nr:signal peptidase II [Thermodesulfovibrio sp. 1176]MDI1471376.1 signal peptidase II [Thermodesulfovibrio sp. 1176]